MPMAPPLTQPEDLGTTCNATTAGDCTTDYCECTHVLHVPLGAVVELFFIDRGQWPGRGGRGGISEVDVSGLGRGLMSMVYGEVIG